MTMAPASSKTRRGMLMIGVQWFRCAAVLPMVIPMRNVIAAKAAKEDFAYQDHPKGAQRCAACRLFTPAPERTGGHCAVVEGDVAPEGWCLAYSARDKELSSSGASTATHGLHNRPG